VSTSRPLVAAGLSALVPGFGQLYNGEPAKAAAILCSTLGIWAGLLWTTIGPVGSRSWLSAAALLLAYPFLLLPAVLDAHRSARGIPQLASSHADRWHVVLMLLVIGPLAIPQLWHNQGFSRGAKIVWTLSVFLVSLIVILMMVAIGPGLEHWLEESSARGLFR
jgi:TM2 domain-containing membrane protein YozV